MLSLVICFLNLCVSANIHFGATEARKLFLILLCTRLWLYLQIKISMDIISQHIATTLGIKEHQVEQTLHLFRNGATIPFISRYRKEATGGLDEVAINDIKENAEKLEELIKRKESIIAAIEKQGKLTTDLQHKIEECWDAGTLEDLYLPYKQKRNSRAEIARQKGLEPLAKIIMRQAEGKLEKHVHSFIRNEVKTYEEALKGARDIIAEWVNENEYARQSIRRLFKSQGIIYSKVQKGKEKEGENMLIILIMNEN